MRVRWGGSWSHAHPYNPRTRARPRMRVRCTRDDWHAAPNSRRPVDSETWLAYMISLHSHIGYRLLSRYLYLAAPRVATGMRRWSSESRRLLMDIYNLHGLDFGRKFAKRNIAIPKQIQMWYEVRSMVSDSTFLLSPSLPCDTQVSTCPQTVASPASNELAACSTCCC
jgi:hypothetical protein